MDTLVHADIFFFVTTIVVGVVGAVFTIALIYLVKILIDLRDITRQVKEEAVLFRQDLGNLRSDIHREGFRMERMVSFFRTFLKSKRPIQRKKKISHRFSKSERKKPFSRLSSKKQTAFKFSISSRSSGFSLNI